jgi:hypothetical protein
MACTCPRWASGNNVRARVTALLVALIVACACTVHVPPTAESTLPLRTSLSDISPQSSAARFAELFCSVLAGNHNEGSWGFCGQYLEMAATPRAIPADDRLDTYRILVVPGIFGECVQDVALPWEDAKRHLHDAHATEVEHVSVPAMGSSPFNAKIVSDYLARQFAGADRRPYIVFAYSKGTPDVLEAIASDAATKDRIAAVVTVAGAVFGSRLTQGVPQDIVAPLKQLKLGPCSVGDGGGVDSLRRRVRAEALTKVPPVRAYSITATSRFETTSAVLQDGWRQLQAFSIDQDSQMIREDAIVPGGVYLGTALGDHWAVALPFDRVEAFHPGTDPAVVQLIHRLVSHSRYPRVALFEAALRFVLEDLKR